MAQRSKQKYVSKIIWPEKPAYVYDDPDDDGSGDTIPDTNIVSANVMAGDAYNFTPSVPLIARADLRNPATDSYLPLPPRPQVPRHNNMWPGLETVNTPYGPVVVNADESRGNAERRSIALNQYNQSGRYMGNPW